MRQQLTWCPFVVLWVMAWHPLLAVLPFPDHLPPPEPSDLKHHRYLYRSNAGPWQRAWNGNSHINPLDIKTELYRADAALSTLMSLIFVTIHQSVVPHPNLLTLEQEGPLSSLARILNWDNKKGVVHTTVENSSLRSDATQVHRLQNLLQFQETEGKFNVYYGN